MTGAEPRMKTFKELGIVLTPLDIHNREFTVSFRGYDADEVNEYLDQIIKDYERCFIAIREMQEQILQLSRNKAPTDGLGESAAMNFSRIQERLRELEQHCFGETRD